MTIKRLHLFISGRVQGVNYRGSVRSAAAREGVTGWVRNLADGRVEAVVEGEEQAVDRLVEFMRSGPPGASVSRLESEIESASGEHESFEIRR